MQNKENKLAVQPCLKGTFDIIIRQSWDTKVSDIESSEGGDKRYLKIK